MIAPVAPVAPVAGGACGGAVEQAELQAVHVAGVLAASLTGASRELERSGHVREAAELTCTTRTALCHMLGALSTQTDAHAESSEFAARLAAALQHIV